MIAVEMMVKKMEEGWDKFRAATFAYTSTAFPMLTGTLVSVAGFLPVGFAKSGAGEYCFTLFAVVTIALLVSWVVAVIFTPYIGVAVLKEQPAGRASCARGRPADGAVPRRAARSRCANRGWVVAGTAGAFVVAVILFGFVQQQFFPSSSRPELHGRPAARAERVDRGDRGAKSSGSRRCCWPIRTSSTTASTSARARCDSIYRSTSSSRTPTSRRPWSSRRVTRCATRCARGSRKCCEDDFDTLMARVEPLALGPPVDWPLQYRVSGPDVSRRARHRRNRGRDAAREPNTRVVNFDWNEMTKSDAHPASTRKRRASSASAPSRFRARCRGAFRPHRHAVPRRHLSDRRAGPRRRRAIAAIVARSARSGDRPAERQLRAARRRSRRFEYGLEETVIWRRNRLPTITVQSKIADGLQAGDRERAAAGAASRRSWPNYRRVIASRSAARSARAPRARRRSWP